MPRNDMAARSHPISPDRNKRGPSSEIGRREAPRKADWQALRGVGVLQRGTRGCRKDFGEGSCRFAPACQSAVSKLHVSQRVGITCRPLASDRRVLCLQHDNGEWIEKVRNRQFGTAR